MKTTLFENTYDNDLELIVMYLDDKEAEKVTRHLDSIVEAITFDVNTILVAVLETILNERVPVRNRTVDAFVAKVKATDTLAGWLF